MTVFKAFLRVLNRCKIPIILYTVCLIGFGGFNMQTGDSNTDFTASKPDILILNRDENAGVTKGLVEYMTAHCNTVDIKNDADAISDALFYRDVSYIIEIPAGYGKAFLDGNPPDIQVKSTGDYEGSYAEMLLSRYLRVARIYAKYIPDEAKFTAAVSETLAQQTEVEVTSKLDAGPLSKATFYYNFANYCLLAGCVYVICLVLSSFKNEPIRKRTLVSSMSERKVNRLLLLSSCLFAFVLWLFYVLLSLVLVGKAMYTVRGALYMANALVFTFCALTLAFLIGNLVKSKNAVNGIVNVVALGSSFLCGAFVPVEWLPDSVLTAAHILPSYWYIQTNECLKTLETIDFASLRPALFNMGMVLVFSLVLIAATNVVSFRKRRFG